MNRINPNSNSRVIMVMLAIMFTASAVKSCMLMVTTQNPRHHSEDSY